MHVHEWTSLECLRTSMATGITLKSPKNHPKSDIFHAVCVAKIPTKIVPKKCSIVSVYVYMQTITNAQRRHWMFIVSI